jgi:hypothetical protein
MLPTYIGIGAPKSATTWLAKCLGEHPDVFMTPKKETSFFDWDTIEGRVSKYETYFEGVKEESAAGELSTRYLASEQAPVRMAELLPGVDLFVSLRDPIEQIQSHYWHLHRQNFHQWDRENVPESLHEALRQYDDKLLDPVRYHTHLQRWLQHFDRSQLLVLFYHDIRSRPEAVLRELYEHVGVDPEFKPSSLNQRDSSTRKGAAPRGETLDRIRRVLYDVLNRKVYYPLKNTIGKERARRIKESFGARKLLETFFMTEGYPEMEERSKEYIRKEVSREVEKLEELTERTLDSWLQV